MDVLIDTKFSNYIKANFFPRLVYKAHKNQQIMYHIITLPPFLERHFHFLRNQMRHIRIIILSTNN